MGPLAALHPWREAGDAHRGDATWLRHRFSKPWRAQGSARGPPAAPPRGIRPGVIYGGGEEPQPINVKFNALLKQLKAGRFLSTLINVKVDGTDNNVICRGVQRDVVKDLPTHVDFLRLTDRSRIALYIPVEYVNREQVAGPARGGVLTEVRPEIELMVTAGDIPEKLVIDLDGHRHQRHHPHLGRDAAGRHHADDHRPRLRDRQHPGAVRPALRGERGGRRPPRADPAAPSCYMRRAADRRGAFVLSGGSDEALRRSRQSRRVLRPAPAQRRLHGRRRHRRGARLRPVARQVPGPGRRGPPRPRAGAAPEARHLHEPLGRLGARGDALLQARARRRRRLPRRARPRRPAGCGSRPAAAPPATTACARSTPTSAPTSPASASASATPATSGWCRPTCSATSPRPTPTGSTTCCAAWPTARRRSPPATRRAS